MAACGPTIRYDLDPDTDAARVRRGEEGVNDYISLLEWARKTFGWYPVFSLNPLLDKGFPCTFEYDRYAEFIPLRAFERKSRFDRLRGTLRMLRKAAFPIRFIMGAGQEPQGNPDRDGYAVRTCIHNYIPNRSYESAIKEDVNHAMLNPVCEQCRSLLQRGPTTRIHCFDAVDIMLDDQKALLEEQDRNEEEMQGFYPRSPTSRVQEWEEIGWEEDSERLRQLPYRTPCRRIDHFIR